MARPKRKVADTVGSLTLRRSPRHATTSRETHQEPVAKRRKTQRHASKKTVEREVEQPPAKVPRKRKAEQKAVNQSSDTHPAATFKPPKNPRATFEELPAELRLQIYELLCESTMIHVHRHREDGKPILDEDDITNGEIKFSWTPCRGTNPRSPLLCANPKWSGMCKEEDRCAYKINEPLELRGFWALAACNKAIRSETKELGLRNSVVSIDIHILIEWLHHLVEYAPDQIALLHRITITALDCYDHHDYAISILTSCLPALEAVGFQFQSPAMHWMDFERYPAWRIQDNAWKKWKALRISRFFEPDITMAFEATTWRSNSTLPPWESYKPPRMDAIRAFGRGKKALIWVPWDRFEVPRFKFEMQECCPLAELKRNAKWRAWWRTKETKDFAL